MEGPAASARIFIADDDRGLLRLIEKVLQREGFVTATALSGQAALEWLRAERPDLLLLDLKLPDLPGQELIQRLSAASRCPPFIIITGQGDERVAVEMMKRGALDYLVKDAEFLAFVPAVVKRALEGLDRERRLAEAEQQVRRLERELLEVSDREQQRIGQDLHDGLCQQLAAIELMSQVLEQKLEKRSKGDAVRAGEIARLVREAIGQTRLVARGLSPVNLESEGLMSALKELAGNTERFFGATCHFTCPEPVLVPNPAVATHLYRIAQEAVSNALKHGKATELRLELVHVANGIRLSVSDNGSGLPARPAGGSGMGLRIMQYRAGMIGGTLSVQNHSGRGTRVICAVPGPPTAQPAPHT
jgi:signal transduction histidine kinase